MSESKIFQEIVTVRLKLAALERRAAEHKSESTTQHPAPPPAVPWTEDADSESQYNLEIPVLAALPE